MARSAGPFGVIELLSHRQVGNILRHIRQGCHTQHNTLALWHITYQYAAPVTLRPSTEAYLGRIYDGYGSWSGARGRTGERRISLDTTGCRRRRNGDDRQLPVWLDVLRPRHPEEIRLGSRLDPVGVHAVRAVRDLAGADRGLVRR